VHADVFTGKLKIFSNHYMNFKVAKRDNLPPAPDPREYPFFYIDKRFEI